MLQAVKGYEQMHVTQRDLLKGTMEALQTKPKKEKKEKKSEKQATSPNPPTSKSTKQAFNS